MMTQLKHSLCWLVGLVYGFCLSLVIFNWQTLSKNTLAISAIVAVIYTLTFAIIAWVLWFFVVNWKRR